MNALWIASTTKIYSRNTYTSNNSYYYTLLFYSAISYCEIFHTWTWFIFPSWTWLLQVDNNYKSRNVHVVTILPWSRLKTELLLGGAEEEFALQCVALLLACYWWSIDTNKGIPKAASLFERHLNIDSVLLLESEGANRSFVAKRSLTNTRQVWCRNDSPILHSQAVSSFWNACRF